MRFLYVILVALALVLIVPSCSKYPNGPAFSLISKTNRLTNDWKLTSYLINGVEFVGEIAELRMIIEKDGTYSRYSTQMVLNQWHSSFEHGVWQFNGDKTSFFLLKDGADLPVEYTILELRSKKLVVQYYNKVTNVTYIYTYTPDK